MTLLLASPGSTEVLIFGVFAIVIYFFVMRWIFRVNTIVENLKIQTQLLAKIAKYGNVPEKELYQAMGILGPEVQTSDEFDSQMSILITDAGIMPAINYAMNLKDMNENSARSYIDKLIANRNLTPKKTK